MDLSSKYWWCRGWSWSLPVKYWSDINIFA